MFNAHVCVDAWSQSLGLGLVLGLNLAVYRTMAWHHGMAFGT